MLENQQLTIDCAVPDSGVNALKIKAVDLPKFPTTRYQGSKRKILPELATALSTIQYNNALDMFSGSGVVSLLFRTLGKNVSSNDFMLYNQNTAKVFLEFDLERLNALNAQSDLEDLLYNLPLSDDGLVSKNYKGIYFIDSENDEIDRFCQNIHQYDDFAKSVYIYAIGQALTKKRPYNLFHRANLEMRTKEVKRSFGNKKTWETPMIEHAIKCINELKKYPIKTADTLSKYTTGFNSADLESFADDFDLIYLDPPYINGKGTPVDYSNFYHFLEGLCDYSLFDNGDDRYPHKPITKKPSAWLKPDSALKELTAICERWPNATIVFSYRSDGLPVPEEAANAMSTKGRTAEIHSAGEYKYALSKTNTNEELIIISKPA
ncbi:DNA adenine methylase [Vibrio parahaemolyticus]|uniref:DNA adenine methylase n=1 Tax=Vibrio parahaemolyticus TaxID=670 RepID=UPI001123B138|nr:DNA adenine methylase [Vibrio parahaemolyticus]EJG0877884.1 DNA adenine methylase [Vibrio parahaemolyticus]MBE4184995.1 type II restriction endonuclease subunit M [Vibrio parahaemolyticus]MDF4600921.1 DNA adenine methylase [Vibrio parahaemolyticus]MDF4630829.1 DNA adenine methylase [Vibrio parahaemolyticus]TOJ28821.1 type II restriction endonuclease subunit M [Vibrio parahaemolyticus]